jgi:hypothetical protein
MSRLRLVGSEVKNTGETEGQGTVYLLSRPFVWLFKLLKKIVLLPAQIFHSVRDRRMRKNVNQMVKANKDAKKESKRQGAA